MSRRTICTASSIDPIGFAPSRTTPPNSWTSTGVSVLYLPKDWLELFSSNVNGESESPAFT